MSIDKEINQRSFRNEYQKAFINLIYTYNWITEKSRPIFERYGITSQQFNILRILRGSCEPLSTMQIRQRMLDKMSDTSRLVDRMIKKGFVKKVVCKTDKRLVDITIAEKGRSLLDQMELCETEMDAILQNMSHEQVEVLNQLLDTIRQAGSGAACPLQPLAG